MVSKPWATWWRRSWPRLSWSLLFWSAWDPSTASQLFVWHAWCSHQPFCSSDTSKSITRWSNAPEYSWSFSPCSCSFLCWLTTMSSMSKLFLRKSRSTWPLKLKPDIPRGAKDRELAQRMAKIGTIQDIRIWRQVAAWGTLQTIRRCLGTGSTSKSTRITPIGSTRKTFTTPLTAMLLSMP